MWSEICTQLVFNLLCIAAAFGVFCLCVIANIVISTYKNARWKARDWNWDKFWNGVKKMLSIGLTTAILAVVATIVPVVLNSAGVVQEDVSAVVSVALVLGLYIKAILKYFKEAVATVQAVLENGNIVADLKGENEHADT